MAEILRTTAAVAMMGGGTVLVGWWAIPIVGLAWGVFGYHGRFPGWIGALAGLLAWTGLLLIAEVRTGTGRVASLTGGVLGVPPAAVYALVAGFASAIGGSSVLVGRGLRNLGHRVKPAGSSRP